jgi:hypothetical protein
MEVTRLTVPKYQFSNFNNVHARQYADTNVYLFFILCTVLTNTSHDRKYETLGIFEFCIIWY